jgi:hypothetical protein
VTKARRERIATEVVQKALAARKAATAAERKRQAEQERHEREERKKARLEAGPAQKSK